MKKLVLIFQEALKIFLTFLLILVWLRLIFSLVTSLILAIIFSLAIWAVTYAIQRRKNNINGMKIKEKTEAEEMFLSLAIDANAVDFFFELAKKKHDKVEKKKSHIIVFHEEEGVKTLLFPEMSMTPLSKNRIMEIYQKTKKEKATKIVICCHSYDRQILPFLENFQEKILLLDEYETYQRLFKLYDYFPKITRTISEKKSTYKDFLAYSFNKKRAKSYLLSALALIFCSFFVSSNIYYCIFASILVVFALISQFNPRFNQPTTQEIL